MIRVLLSLLLLQGPALPSPGPGGAGGGVVAATYVQEKDCSWFGGSGLTETCTLTSNVGAASGVIVFIGWATAASTISSVQDAAPTSYTNTVWASGATNCQGNGADARVYTLANSAGGANTKAIKVTWSADPGYGAISIIEAANVPTVSMVDKADCQYQTFTTAPTSPSVTTTGADFLFGASFNANGDSVTWTAGTTPAYTFVGTNGSWHGHEYSIQTSGQAVTGNFTTSNDLYSTAIIALKP